MPKRTHRWNSQKPSILKLTTSLASVVMTIIETNPSLLFHQPYPGVPYLGKSKVAGQMNTRDLRGV